MSTDLTRSAITRIAIIGIIAGGAGFFFVKPKMTAASDLRAESERRIEFIRAGESNIALHQEQLEELVSSTIESRKAMLEDLSPDDDLQDQQVFQRMAAARGLTITRVEPLRESSNAKEIGEFGAEAVILQKEYRIECRGSFSGLVRFIEDIQQSNRHMSVSNFRLVPTDAKRIRCSLTISMVELTAYPESLDTVFNPKSASGGAGLMNGGEE